MVNKRLISGLIAAFSLVLAFPALASAHTLCGFRRPVSVRHV